MHWNNFTWFMIGYIMAWTMVVWSISILGSIQIVFWVTQVVSIAFVAWSLVLLFGYPERLRRRR